MGSRPLLDNLSRYKTGPESSLNDQSHTVIVSLGFLSSTTSCLPKDWPVSCTLPLIYSLTLPSAAILPM